MEMSIASVRIMSQFSKISAVATGHEDLLTRSTAGDRAAKEELARICLARIRRTVFLVSSGGQDLDDIVQTALIRVFKKLHTVRNPASFFSWLDKITINTTREHYRRRPLEKLFSLTKEPDVLPAEGITDPSQQLENRRLLEQITVHLHGIRVKKRTALVLSIVYGYSVSEIAQLTGCSKETAKKRLQHGRREMMAKVRRDKYLSRVFEETTK